MANELVHASAGTTLTQAEFEAVGLHVCNSQATGDLIYASSASQLSRLAIGATNKVLTVIGGVPTWQSTLAGLTLTSPVINGTVTTTGLTLPAVTLGGVVTAYAGSGIVRTVTKVVAASDADATVKLQADYVCDGTADDVQIQAAIAALTAGRTWIETVKCIGQFTIAAHISLASYTHLDLREGRLLAGNLLNDNILTLNTITDVEISGYLDGNRLNQTTAGECIYATGVTRLNLPNIKAKSGWGHNIDLVNCSEVRFNNIETYDSNRHGIRFDSCSDVAGSVLNAHDNGVIHGQGVEITDGCCRVAIASVLANSNSGNGLEIFGGYGATTEEITVSSLQAYNNGEDGLGIFGGNADVGAGITQGVVVTGVKAKGNTQAGCRIDNSVDDSIVRYIQVSGIFTGNTENGVDVLKSGAGTGLVEHIRLEGIAENNTERGARIYAGGVTDVDILMDLVHNTLDGLYVDGGSRISFFGRVDNNGEWGIEEVNTAVDNSYKPISSLANTLGAILYSDTTQLPPLSGFDDLPQSIFANNFLYIPPDALFAETVTGSGVTALTPTYLLVRTAATASSTAMRNSSLSGLSVAGQDARRMSWDKKLYFSFVLTRRSSDAECIARFQIKETNAIGALAALGLGVRLDNYVLVGESYGTNLGSVDLGTTVASGQLYKILIILYPGSKIEWYVNGILGGTQSTAANIPSGNAGADSYLVSSISNGITGGVDARFEIGQIGLWQKR